MISQQSTSPDVRAVNLKHKGDAVLLFLSIVLLVCTFFLWPKTWAGGVILGTTALALMGYSLFAWQGPAWEMPRWMSWGASIQTPPKAPDPLVKNQVGTWKHLSTELRVNLPAAPDGAQRFAFAGTLPPRSVHKSQRKVHVKIQPTGSDVNWRHYSLVNGVANGLTPVSTEGLQRARGEVTSGIGYQNKTYYVLPLLHTPFEMDINNGEANLTDYYLQTTSPEASVVFSTMTPVGEVLQQVVEVSSFDSASFELTAGQWEYVWALCPMDPDYWGGATDQKMTPLGWDPAQLTAARVATMKDAPPKEIKEKEVEDAVVAAYEARPLKDMQYGAVWWHNGQGYQSLASPARHSNSSLDGTKPIRIGVNLPPRLTLSQPFRVVVGVSRYER